MLGTNLRCLDNLNGIWGFDTSNSLQTTSLVVLLVERLLVSMPGILESIGSEEEEEEPENVEG